MADRKGIRISFALSIIFILLLGLVLQNYLYKQDETSRIEQILLINNSLIDSSIHLMQDGDIIVRAGNDMISIMLGSINKMDKTYSHCGIIMCENDIAHVYHSIGGEDNPDEQLKYENVSKWLNPNNIDGFAVVRYNLNDQELAKLDSLVKWYYNKPILFDMNFDLQTDDRFYCSEFVYKSISKAIDNMRLIIVDTVQGRPYIGVDRLILNRRAKLICKVKFK